LLEVEVELNRSQWLSQLHQVGSEVLYWLERWSRLSGNLSKHNADNSEVTEIEKERLRRCHNWLITESNE
jgi:hypothetical protein